MKEVIQFNMMPYRYASRQHYAEAIYYEVCDRLGAKSRRLILNSADVIQDTKLQLMLHDCYQRACLAHDQLLAAALMEVLKANGYSILLHSCIDHSTLVMLVPSPNAEIVTTKSTEKQSIVEKLKNRARTMRLFGATS